MIFQVERIGVIGIRANVSQLRGSVGRAAVPYGWRTDRAQGSAYGIVSSLCEKSAISLTEW
ncbi:MAG: hypothetical protein K2H52_14855 [Lachnospiraceae bacterium]|nr:hypothetical protein [Lachnospiraceae bacterium]MDE6185629.1 hypothetical protein [Lachnospiraceae bacterium]